MTVVTEEVPELAVLCKNDIKLMAAACDKITGKLNFEATQGNSQVLELTVDTGASVCIFDQKLSTSNILQKAPLTEPKLKLITCAKGDDVSLAVVKLVTNKNS